MEHHEKVFWKNKPKTRKQERTHWYKNMEIQVKNKKENTEVVFKIIVMRWN